MGAEENGCLRHLLMNPQDELTYFPAPNRIEATHGLVENEQPRAIEEGLSDRKTLYHSLTESLDSLFRGMPEIHQSEQLVTALAQLSATQIEKPTIITQ